MGNWWLAASSWQCACSCIMSHAEFFGETSNHPGDSAPLQLWFGTLWLTDFPKSKITFEREEISELQWDSGKYDRTADGNWENCVRSPAYFEGDWGIIAYEQCFLYLVSSSINVFIFHITWLDTIWKYIYSLCPSWWHRAPESLVISTSCIFCSNVWSLTLVFDKIPKSLGTFWVIEMSFVLMKQFLVGS